MKFNGDKRDVVVLSRLCSRCGQKMITQGTVEICGGCIGKEHLANGGTFKDPSTKKYQ